MRLSRIAAIALGSCTLAACATPQSPVEVTRFHDSAALSRIGHGAIFIESAPGGNGEPLELAPYKAAVATQLAALGYREGSREEADQIAQIRLERYVAHDGGKDSPVSVGVGGSTGSYGSGVGMGIGINLGGGPKKMLGTDLGVTIRDKASGASLWEGRAQLKVTEKSPLASSSSNAQTVAAALFRDFPGGNGETVSIGVD